MSEYSGSVVLPCSASSLRYFLGVPANLPRISNPDLELEILSAPDVIAVSERIEFRVTSFGFKHRSTHVYTVVTDSLIEEEQVDGPMRKWVHRQQFDSLSEDQTRLSDHFEFTPPGGMMGFILTEASLKKSIAEGLAVRYAELQNLIASGELQ